MKVDGIWKGNIPGVWNAAVRIRSRKQHMLVGKEEIQYSTSLLRESEEVSYYALCGN